MDLEIIMENEITRFRKTNSTCSLSYVELSPKKKLMFYRNVSQVLFGGEYQSEGAGSKERVEW
jgi:hypothetical protein